MASKREYPERPLVGVGVVVRRQGRVLLIKRAHAPKAGEWSLPGGLLKLGERVIAAAMREVYEETSVDVHVIGIIDVIDLIERDEVGDVRYHFTLVDVVADWTAGEARAGGDAAAVVWADAGDFDRFQLWDETVRVIGLAMKMP